MDREAAVLRLATLLRRDMVHVIRNTCAKGRHFFIATINVWISRCKIANLDAMAISVHNKTLSNKIVRMDAGAMVSHACSHLLSQIHPYAPQARGDQFLPRIIHVSPDGSVCQELPVGVPQLHH